MKKIVDIIDLNNFKVRWCCRARFDSEFSEELIAGMARCGCVMISLGVETTIDRLNAMLMKGVKYRDILNYIALFSKHNIAVKLTMISNIPTETVEEARDNIHSLHKLSKYVIDIKLNKFRLFKDTYIAYNPERYSIRKIYDEVDYRIYVPYTQIDSEGMKQAQDVSDMYDMYKSFEKMCGFISEEHMLLYLDRYGVSEVKRLVKSRNDMAV